jgi:hypothetical protein
MFTAKAPLTGNFRSRRIGCDPSPLPPFLEVLILEELRRDFSEVLILGDLKSNAENEIRGLLEVLILKGLKFDFSEVLILEELQREKREIKGFLRGVLRRGSIRSAKRESAGRVRAPDEGFSGDADLRFTRAV